MERLNAHTEEQPTSKWDLGKTEVLYKDTSIKAYNKRRLLQTE